MSGPVEYSELQRIEYATFRAVARIFHEGAPAYNVGDPVPVSNVEKHGYEAQGLVERVPAGELIPTADAADVAAPGVPADPATDAQNG